MTNFEAPPALPVEYRELDSLVGRSQSIFPLPVADMDEVRERLSGPVTLEDQRSFVNVREAGSASDMLTLVYGANFDAWHRDEGRLSGDEDTLLYKIAQLYGLRLASDVYYRFNGERLPADSLEAYDAACAAVKRSYRVIDIRPEDPRWQVEGFRGQVYTGSNVTGIMLGFIKDSIIEHYKQLYETDPTIPEDQILNSLHTGMLDSQIFFNTFLRARQGLGEELFLESINYATPVSMASSPEFELEEAFAFGASDSLASRFLGLGESSRWFDITPDGKVEVTKRVLVQTGPGNFRTAMDTQVFEPSDPSLGGLFDNVRMPQSLSRFWAGRIALSGLIGGFIAGAHEVVNHAPVESVVLSGLQGVGFGLAFGLGAAGWSLAKRSVARR